MKPAPAQKKRKGVATRCSGEANIVNLTRANKYGQLQSMSKPSEEENDAPHRNVVVANKTSSGIKPNARAREIASQSWWESPEAHALFCDVKRSTGDNGDFLFPQEYVEIRIARMKQ